MKLQLKRCWTLDGCTLGGLAVDGRFQCFALEDVPHEVKVPGQTRIPAGEYAVLLRTTGAMHAEYAGRFSDHRGMLWLQNVPNFEWVYLHCGNTAADTAGCILLGDTLRAAGRVDDSVQAYRRVYGTVSNAILSGEPVTIAVED